MLVIFGGVHVVLPDITSNGFPCFNWGMCSQELLSSKYRLYSYTLRMI